MGDRRPDLGVHALAHLDRAGRDGHGPIGVHVDQGLCLVQGSGSERDPEADRDDIHPPALQRVGRVERMRRGDQPGRVVARHERRPALARPDVAQWHPEVGDVALGDEVALLQDHGRDAHLPGGGPDRRLEHGDRLRGAEPAEGRVGRQVRPAAGSGDPDVGDGVGVGGVEQRALEDRRREVGRAAGVLQQRRLVGHEPPVRIQAEAEVRGVRVPLSGDPHVVPAIRGHPDRSAGRDSAQGGERGPRRGLLLLAAEAAPQSRDLELDEVHRQTGHGRHRPLGRTRRLRGGVHQQPAVVAWDGQRAVRLEVGVLLGAELDPTGHDRRAPGPRRIDVAGGERPGRGQHLARLVRLAGVEEGREHHPVSRHELGGPPRGVGGIGDHERHRLTDAVDLSVGEQGLVVGDAADLVVAGDVGGREHRTHTRLAGGGRDIEGGEPRMGMRRDRHHRVQATSREGEVPCEPCGPAHEQVPGVGAHRAAPAEVRCPAGRSGGMAGPVRPSTSAARPGWPSVSAASRRWVSRARL